MKGRMLAALAGVLFLSVTAHAQKMEQKAESLTPAQLNGKVMFRQRCSICHTAPLPTAKSYGPMIGTVLNQDLVNANEEMIRGIIVKGTPHMPGFGYGLQPQEIDNIVAYLKTVKKTEAPVQQQQKGPEQID
jgi:mono/diheme cytochrome c family protein